MERVYIIREVKVTLNNRSEILIVENFNNENLYCCKFSIRDDNEESFYNKYDTFGFYTNSVEDKVSFHLKGKIDEETAKEIWKQILPQLSLPNPNNYTITVNF